MPGESKLVGLLGKSRKSAGGTHPDEHVIDEVTGVPELAAERSELEERVRQVERLDRRLSVLEGLPDAHH